ncbi:MAG: hypothetical protein ACFN23_05685, partial [Capnocytophaga gingivalis]
HLLILIAPHLILSMQQRKQEKQYTELTSLSWEGQRTFTDTDFQIVITLAVHRDTNRATAIFIGSTQQELFDTLLDAMENFGLEWDYTSYDDES